MTDGQIERVARAIQAVRMPHYHVNDQSGTDRCQDCGEDIRHDIHIMMYEDANAKLAMHQAMAAIEILQEASRYQGCMCDACRPHAHDSDCAVHNEPATARGVCDCDATPPTKG